MKYILDCTLRDGGYINNWRFNQTFLNQYINIMELINIDYVEIGFINKSNNYKDELVGVVRNLDEETISKFQNKKFKISVMADYSDINMELLRKNMNIDLVRVAFHKNDLIPALNICSEIKKMGYKVSVNAMAITNYNENELKFLFDNINLNKLDLLYIADSYGSLNQPHIKYYLELFKNNLNNDTIIGFHLHNNMNNAYSNYESFHNMKYDLFIDSTLFGMGRGAGNLQTELVSINKQIDFNNLMKLLYFIQEYIKPIYKCSENSWGYDLDYLLSGYLKMHPNYVVKMRDLNITMNNRLFLIEILRNNYNCTTFDKNIISELINLHKEKLL
jgi:4-hydroxy 2-oxovalerate aldolase